MLHAAVTFEFCLLKDILEQNHEELLRKAANLPDSAPQQASPECTK